MSARILILFFIISNLIPKIVHAQCGCMSSISIGTLSPNLGASSTGTMREGFLSANVSGIYLFGNRYLSGSKEINNGIVKEFENVSSMLYLSYGFTNRFTLDIEAAASLMNRIEAPPFVFKNNGLNYMNVIGKYNLLYLPRNDFEITLGAGVKQPLQLVSDTNYKYTQPSQGAYAAIYQIFLHKGFKSSEIHLFLVHRGEFFSPNGAEYLYGPFIQTSISATKPLSENFIALLELKNELKFKDKNLDEINFDSGFSNLTISPQLIWVYRNYSISAKYDYPFVRYYNGSQSARNYTVSLNLGINTRLF